MLAVSLKVAHYAQGPLNLNHIFLAILSTSGERALEIKLSPFKLKMAFVF